MCGIAGKIEMGRTLNLVDSGIGIMTQALGHRGPDDRGTRGFGHAALGNRRLSVIDIEHGRQPMQSPTPRGPITITYNGEVYNARALRRELKDQGVIFRGETDTEVVLNGYREWGEGVVTRLRGMFAFGIWDEPNQKAILARDPIGMKPLCFSETAHGLEFASEPKALFAAHQVKPVVGLDGWRGLVGVIRTPGYLIWDGMQEVKPGSVIVYDNGIHERPPYWQLNSQLHEDNPEKTAAKVRGMLERIVPEQMFADVPISVLLSGGLDSSIIAALMANRGKSIESYVVDYIGHKKYLGKADVLQAGYDTPFSEEVASRWGIDHTRVELDSLQLASPEMRERVIRAEDMPPYGWGDTEASRLLLFEAICENSKVALSGDMADELFGGYKIFSDEKVLNGDRWPWYEFNPEEFTSRLVMLTPEFKRLLDMDTFLHDTYANARNSVPRLAGESQYEHNIRVLKYLEMTYHSGTILTTLDRLSSAVGLEVRAPFTDQELLQYGFNIPGKLVKYKGEEKGVLKAAFNDLEPSSVLKRPKSPYPWAPNPDYLIEIQRQGKELATLRQHAVFDFIDRNRLIKLVNKPVEKLTLADRVGINFALEVALWIDLYKPTFKTS